MLTETTLKHPTSFGADKLRPLAHRPNLPTPW
jgi:hypothetical protein